MHDDQKLYRVQTLWSNVLYSMLQQGKDMNDSIIAADQAVAAFKRVGVDDGR